MRSAGPEGLRTPHTGGTSYGDSPTRIPIAAITAEDAAQLQRMQDRGWRPVVHLRMGAQTFPDVESANVVAEIVGREKPNEVVVIGAHLDGWDASMGAHDDGGACIAMSEALRILKNLGLKPRRTIRVVLFVDEELAQGGGRAYRDRYRDELANHVMMLESDGGVFRPLGFGLTGNDRARASVTDIATLLKEIGADRIGPSGGGVDIGPSVEVGRMPSMSLDVDATNYFLLHHTTADTVERVVPADLAKCVAAVAVMSYVIADMPVRLGQ